MPTDRLPIRHAMLFELLRQQSLSDATARRLVAEARPVAKGDAILLQTRARKSLARQCLAGTTPASAKIAAPPPARTRLPGAGPVPLA